MDVLYHASPDKNLKTIETKKTLSKDIYIGDYVFATADKKLAIMYLATKGNSTYMEPRGSEPFIVISADSKRYLANDKGGAIYAVPPVFFEKTPQDELQSFEMVSKTNVKPLYKEVYVTSIDAMRQHGIKIYFVNQSKFDEIVKAKDKKIILDSASPFN